MSSPKKIVVHEKALAHLSRGLYRSPASALRELISNGWDANARNVHVDTNYPTFFQLSVRDDGDGFSKPEFERLMAGNIGNSDKRPKDVKLINERPTIGRLGIGMLGIAQICGSFKITSKPKVGEPFCARIHLYDLLKERLDRDDSDIVKTVETSEADTENSSIKEIDVGEYEYVKFDPDSLDGGTIIVTDDIHPTFTQTFLESLRLENFVAPPRNWSKCLNIVSKAHSLQQLGDYWRLLWELAACCPIPYVSSDCLPNDLAKTDFKRLKSYDFNVFVDGIRLAKPVQLSGNPGGYTSRQIEPQTKRIYGRDLMFHGYLLVQEGLQLRPDELRGIMIRIKDVAIGYYDPSMLDYRFNEGPRSRWLTGELFVGSGLEDALNIDRDSFNKFNPQYRYIQQIVHKLLHEEIFKEVYKNIEVRSKRRATKKRHERHDSLESILSTSEGSKVKIQYSSNIGRTSDISIAKSAQRMDVTAREPSDIPTKKTYRELASAILVLFELALQERTADERRTKFSEMLFNLLKKW